MPAPHPQTTENALSSSAAPSTRASGPNRLIHETSPYLLQHAHNPVDWRPWGEEALREARELDRPILLSIGYSACHWCHVMERESFEDAAIAELMNEHFIPVKVDREERPDLDEIYMAATQALNAGQGGWPMTVFLTPDQEPFFAGTYFPPTDRGGRPGFATLLTRIAELWRDERASLRDHARKLSDELRRHAGAGQPLPVRAEAVGDAVVQLGTEFDRAHGGFGRAPKFPPTAALSLLLRHHRRTGDAAALEMVKRTLDGMARGGIYDQVGGGFARYSVDERWLVPHFEKMLYDNALLARTYVEGWQATADPLHRRIASETLDYLLREMTGPEGGFYSATDADSEGVEGKFFVWTPAELEEVLGAEEARRLAAWFDVTERGNWEGKSILHTPRTLLEVAEDLGIGEEELARSIALGRERLYEARRRRVPPGLDDKVLTGWNGLAIGALAEGHRALREPRWLAAAERAAAFLRATLTRPDGGLFRTWRAGRAHLDGVLEDYAYLAEGLLTLYEAGGAEAHLHEALRLAERVVTDFTDPVSGAFFSTARGHESLLLRHRDGYDGATPNANAVAALCLARLSWHFDRDDLREAARRAIAGHGRVIARFPRVFPSSLAVADFLREEPLELAVIGASDDPRTEALLREVGARHLPNRIIAHAAPPRPSELPLLAGKLLVAGRPALYVCHGYACRAPVTEPEAVAAALEDATPAE